MAHMKLFMFALVCCLGVIFGSFINALVWRLAKQEGLDTGEPTPKKPKAKTSAKKSVATTDYSITTGRSMCPQCHHTLAAKDLVPVLSWLSLRGKCRYCGQPISRQYPLVELLTGLLFMVFYLGWPFSLSGLHLVQFVYGLIYIVFFVALAVYDARWFLLPDKLVFSLTGLAVTQVSLTAVWTGDVRALWEPLAAAGVISGLFWVLYQVSGGRWIGGGDVKLAVALGLIVASPLQALLLVFCASLLGMLGSIPVLLGGKEGLKAHIPFGPYLLAGCFIVLLWGERLWTWYMSLTYVG